MLQPDRPIRWKSILMCAFLLSISGTTQTHAQATFSYFDDFGTNKAIADSYLHSPFVDTRPDIYLDGLLMYSYVSPGNRVLGFYDGFEVDADAFLDYRFPVGGGSISSTAGRLEFDLGSLLGYSRHMEVSVSYDPGPGGFAVTIYSLGHYEYDLTPPQPFGGVYVHFRGGAVYLDNLLLVFNSTTSAEEATGGRIKVLFR